MLACNLPKLAQIPNIALVDGIDDTLLIHHPCRSRTHVGAIVSLDGKTAIPGIGMVRSPHGKIAQQHKRPLLGIPRLIPVIRGIVERFGGLLGTVNAIAKHPSRTLHRRCRGNYQPAFEDTQQIASAGSMPVLLHVTNFFGFGGKGAFHGRNLNLVHPFELVAAGEVVAVEGLTVALANQAKGFASLGGGVGNAMQAAIEDVFLGLRRSSGDGGIEGI